MNTLSSITDVSESDIFNQIASAIETQGYIVLSSVLPEPLTNSLFIHLKSTKEQDFYRAGIGREFNYHVNQFVRTDQICWIDQRHSATKAYLAWIERLRLELNRRLFLGLFDYECHFACYPVGAFYKRHLDAFSDSRNRIITTVLYLNPNWMPDDGGELLLYSIENNTLLEKIAPEYGKMVLFLSEKFPHEVVTTNKLRYSLSGWFRVNNSFGAVIDPPK
ncbi:2OG-Fe(II) oxygenase [Nitrosococcus wardiae]|uniref:2OG-Fe(II) oxygenase n=1 Tax=Nitrosococcus wardiae TaxID=1814290 RepID=UPI00141B9681|nr:2OG-Fe(II) oxygenase [Nitrosococcus wardiae]